jgi:hypothetical protein
MEASVTDIYATPAADADAEQILDPYPDQRAARHVKLAVTWESKALARDLAPHLLGLTYVDNLSGAADDLSLDLEDREALWAGDWQPTFGDKVVARLEYQGWFGARPGCVGGSARAHGARST